jgi:hypothetical protein
MSERTPMSDANLAGRVVIRISSIFVAFQLARTESPRLKLLLVAIERRRWH